MFPREIIEHIARVFAHANGHDSPEVYAKAVGDIHDKLNAEDAAKQPAPPTLAPAKVKPAEAEPAAVSADAAPIATQVDPTPTPSS